MGGFQTHTDKSTVCPGSSDPFYIVTYYIKGITTSCTHSTTTCNALFIIIMHLIYKGQNRGCVSTIYLFTFLSAFSKICCVHFCLLLYFMTQIYLGYFDVFPKLNNLHNQAMFEWKKQHYLFLCFKNFLVIECAVSSLKLG